MSVFDKNTKHVPPVAPSLQCEPSFSASSQVQGFAAVYTSPDLNDLAQQCWHMLKSYHPSTHSMAAQLEQLARNRGDECMLAESQLILGVCALDQTRANEAIERFSFALSRFRWLSHEELEWYTLSSLAQAWYLLDDYDQMHVTLLSAKPIPKPSTSEKFKWLDRIGMIR